MIGFEIMKIMKCSVVVFVLENSMMRVMTVTTTIICREIHIAL